MNEPDIPVSRTAPVDATIGALPGYPGIGARMKYWAARNRDGVVILWNEGHGRSRTFLSMGCVKRDDEPIMAPWNMEQNL